MRRFTDQFFCLKMDPDVDDTMLLWQYMVQWTYGHLKHHQGVESTRLKRYIQKTDLIIIWCQAALPK